MTNAGGCKEAPPGLWRVKEDVPVRDDGGRLALGTYIFAFDGNTVVLQLITRHPGQWKSDDDFYRLEAEWRDATLYFRPPFADWVELAAFEDGRFVQTGSGRKRIFERIDESQVPEWSRAILKAREPHDYRIRPDDAVAPS